MKLESRSLDQLVDEQLSKWQAQRRLRARASAMAMDQEKLKPVMTVSIEPGSGGVEIATRLARLLNMDLLGSEIIQRIAESARMSEKDVELLDEKEAGKLNAWLDSLFGGNFSPDDYFRHLNRVIGTIGKLGNAILLGRGAQYILQGETTFRLRIIAPRDFRTKKLMGETGQSRKDAADFIQNMETVRRSFIKRYFQRDITDPLGYDLLLNVENLSIDAAVSIIQTAFRAKFPDT